MKDKKLEVMKKDMDRLMNIQESSKKVQAMMEEYYPAFLAMDSKKKNKMLNELFKIEKEQFTEKVNIITDMLAHIDEGIYEDHPDIPISTEQFREQLENELEKTKCFEKMLDDIIGWTSFDPKIYD